MVLLDDSYPTLVHAIRKGRTIYNNLKKTVLASLTTNGAELTIVLLGLIASSLFGWAIPILTIQILSIDLLGEILPLTALTYDPGSKKLMTSPPRRRDEHIVNIYSFTEIVFLALLIGGLAFANYGILAGDISPEHPLYPRATTTAYLTIVICQFFNIMSRRYEYTTLFNSNFFTNKKMLYSILISIIMVLIVIYTPFINHYLGFTGVTLGDWVRVILAGFIFLSGHEVIKWYKRSQM